MADTIRAGGQCGRFGASARLVQLHTTKYERQSATGPAAPAVVGCG